MQAIAAGVPAYMVGSLAHFILDGRPVGSFLQAILENDYKTACAHADADNQRALWAYANFLYNHAPIGCWGSPEAFAGWRDRGGLNGVFLEAEKLQAEKAKGEKA